MSSTSLSGGNLVDGLPLVSSVSTIECSNPKEEVKITRNASNVPVNSTQAVNHQPGFRLKDS